ncbi:MAG TPA: flagellar hook capping FlgD N-terminal domain-containing protein [Conexibacter sp.]|jgi:flagellar basal-body rod modification protein FlgD
MPIDPIDSSPNAPTISQPAPRDPSILGKDDFLKLLIGQMQNQDPMNPTDESDEMGQMTQFAMLEQMTNLGSTASAAASNDYENQAVNLVGRQVTYLRVSGSGDSARYTSINARVDSVKFTTSGPVLELTTQDGRKDEAAPVSVTNVWGADGAPATPPPAGGGDDDGSGDSRTDPTGSGGDGT